MSGKMFSRKDFLKGAFGLAAHKWHIDRAMPKAKARCEDVSVAFWGDRIV